MTPVYLKSCSKYSSKIHRKFLGVLSLSLVGKLMEMEDLELSMFISLTQMSFKRDQLMKMIPRSIMETLTPFRGPLCQARKSLLLRWLRTLLKSSLTITRTRKCMIRPLWQILLHQLNPLLTLLLKDQVRMWRMSLKYQTSKKKACHMLRVSWCQWQIRICCS
jgi:hypothetical protein